AVTQASELAAALHASLVARSPGTGCLNCFQVYLAGGALTADFPIEPLRGYIVAAPGPLVWPDRPRIEAGAAATLATTDHAGVVLPSGLTTSAVTVSFTRTTPLTSGGDTARPPVSSEYLLTVRGIGPVHGSYLQSIPLRDDLLPAGWNQERLQPERWDDSTHKWVRTGELLSYNPSTRTLSFFDSFHAASVSTSPVSTGTGKGTAIGLGGSDEGFDNYASRIRITHLGGLEAFHGPRFTIWYYPPDSGHQGSVPGDWTSASGLQYTTDAPQYVQDLNLALDSAYDGLQDLWYACPGTGYDMHKVFDAMRFPQNVYVLDLGGGSGDSRIGGPVGISNQGIADWSYMRAVAGHELVHALQGKYYWFYGSSGGADQNSWAITQALRPNRWFIEATAEYFSHKAI
ncbi:MAG: hypothetical protein HY303_21230, partial [Candidatus Wallbacteria bacterium]|nr:hypothetical protein [Candidatus Wallbacteria bacterium]